MSSTSKLDVSVALDTSGLYGGSTEKSLMNFQILYTFLASLFYLSNSKCLLIFMKRLIELKYLQPSLKACINLLNQIKAKPNKMLLSLLSSFWFYDGVKPKVPYGDRNLSLQSSTRHFQKY